MRYLAREAELTVLAIETIDQTLGECVAPELWEGEDVQVHRGSADALAAMVAARGLGLDVAFCSLADVRLLGLTQRLGARRTCCMFHDYHSVPWGPLVRPGGVCEGAIAADMVARLDSLLCTSQDVATYAERWVRCGCSSSTVPTASACPATDYDYVTPRADCMQPWLPRHQYCTMVSPCAVKGLAVLLRLANELPHVPFLAIQTVWTKPSDLLALWLHTPHRNVRVVPAVADFTEWLQQTKVLLVPSLCAQPDPASRAQPSGLRVAPMSVHAHILRGAHERACTHLACARSPRKLIVRCALCGVRCTLCAVRVCVPV